MSANSLRTFKLTELKPHPWQRNIPNIEGGDWTAFIADIRARGVREPVRVSLRTHEPVIVDGHQRVRAAREVGLTSVEVLTENFADELEEITHLAGSARFRRHLTDPQRYAIAKAYRELFKPQAEESKGGRPKKLTANLQQVSKPRQDTTAQKAAEMVGMSERQFHKADTIAESNLEPVKEAWRESKVSTHAAHTAVRAPDPIQDAISTGAVSVDDGIAVAKDKVLSKAVELGEKTVEEAVSVAQQMKQAHQAEKNALDFDVTHKVLKLLESVTNLELSEYHRAAHSGESAKIGGDSVALGIEDAITHLQKAAEAIRIVEMPGDQKTITANFN